jgi:hypothetical protein
MGEEDWPSSNDDRGVSGEVVGVRAKLPMDDNAVSGDEVVVHAKLGMDDRVEVERARDLTVGLEGMEDSELETDERDLDPDDGLCR